MLMSNFSNFLVLYNLSDRIKLNLNVDAKDYISFAALNSTYDPIYI